jgi:hypothetical protein
MNIRLRFALFSVLCFLPLGAQEGESLRGIMAVHTSVPLGVLSNDVNGQVGFGISVGIQQPLTQRLAVRGSFSWTGYRVNDRNLWNRAFASMLDSGYSENQMVLRSYTLGADLIVYTGNNRYGAYFLGGGGIQRSRLYVEHRDVDSQGNESTQNLATWPAADTPYVSLGIGYQGRTHTFIEGKVQQWRYNGIDGVRLLESPRTGQPTLRDATSLTISVGVRF